MKNIKTTITGLLLAVLMGIQPLIETGEIVLKRDWLKITIAIGIASLGYLTKDNDRTRS